MERNSFTGPSYQGVNVSLAKGFNIPTARVIGEHAALEFRVDAYNLFNFRSSPVQPPASPRRLSAKAGAHWAHVRSSCSHASLSKPRFLKGCAWLAGRAHFTSARSQPARSFPLTSRALFFPVPRPSPLARKARPCCGRRLPRASLLDRSKAIPRYHASELHHGLGYESAQLGHPEFFSKNNKQLSLPSSGGWAAKCCASAATPQSTPPGVTMTPTPPKTIHPLRLAPTLALPPRWRRSSTPLAITNLNDFVQAIGWRVIYGLDLRHGTPENAAASGRITWLPHSATS